MPRARVGGLAMSAALRIHKRRTRDWSGRQTFWWVREWTTHVHAQEKHRLEDSRLCRWFTTKRENFVTPVKIRGRPFWLKSLILSQFQMKKKKWKNSLPLILTAALTFESSLTQLTPLMEFTKLTNSRPSPNSWIRRSIGRSYCHSRQSQSCTIVVTLHCAMALAILMTMI